MKKKNNNRDDDGDDGKGYGGGTSRQMKWWKNFSRNAIWLVPISREFWLVSVNGWIDAGCGTCSVIIIMGLSSVGAPVVLHDATRLATEVHSHLCVAAPRHAAVPFPLISSKNLHKLSIWAVWSGSNSATAVFIRSRSAIHTSRRIRSENLVDHRN